MNTSPLYLPVLLLCFAATSLTEAKETKRKDAGDGLDHAGIIRSLDAVAFEGGKTIYEGLCINCHGADGKVAPVPIARAFGVHAFKFGNDYYSIFKTLTTGNGLMGPMPHLSPAERYQVAHYIREHFVKPFDNGYQPADEAYLKSLPKGKGRGEAGGGEQRDFGPGLASQLGRDTPSVMSIRLGGVTIAYNLHSLDQADIWSGGFLDLSKTQHARLRGEGVAVPDGKAIGALHGWSWGHDGKLDYPRENLLPRGPMPAKWLEYEGHYLFEDKLLFAYKIDRRPILELPGGVSGSLAMTHDLQIGAGEALLLCVAQPQVKGTSTKSAAGTAENGICFAGAKAGEGSGAFSIAQVFGDTEGLSWSVGAANELLLHIPQGEHKREIRILRSGGDDSSSLAGFKDIAKLVAGQALADFDILTRGGPARWTTPVTSAGKLGDGEGAYTLDELVRPASDPWNSWFRTTALDFFSDGRLAVSTHGGDIWIVSGIDATLGELRWKRFAAGLYEPMGLRVVDDVVYVTCKDRLTRLHDFNADGEADFYESFAADADVSTFFHAYNFDLQTDAEGNFYYAKSGQYTSLALPGAVIKVGPDGGVGEVYSTGLRTPNGMGITKDGRLTVSDNEGNWMPASKVNLIKPGGFYGYVQTHAKPGLWAPDGGKIDHTKVVPPSSFDPPMIWIPRAVENSSGGQIWVDDPRWGPLSGRMIHTSFGQGKLYYFLMQDVGDVAQAAVVRLPHEFVTGIMRARVNPKDGQLYATGLNGWNGGGRKNLADGGIERLRYTGKPFRMVTGWAIEPDGIRLSFNFPLAGTPALSDFTIEQWNYLWSTNYGSKEYRVSDGKQGKEPVTINAVELSADKRSAKLIIPTITPADQIHAKLTIEGADGVAFEEQLWMTVNKVPRK